MKETRLGMKGKASSNNANQSFWSTHEISKKMYWEMKNIIYFSKRCIKRNYCNEVMKGEKFLLRLSGYIAFGAIYVYALENKCF